MQVILRPAWRLSTGCLWDILSLALTFPIALACVKIGVELTLLRMLMHNEKLSYDSASPESMFWHFNP